jgi:hypothetical protein
MLVWVISSSEGRRGTPIRGSHMTDRPCEMSPAWFMVCGCGSHLSTSSPDRQAGQANRRAQA